MQANSNRNSKLAIRDKKRIANSFNELLEYLNTLSEEELNNIQDSFEMNGKTIKLNSLSRRNALHYTKTLKSQKNAI